jgi:putative membrane protein
MRDRSLNWAIGVVSIAIPLVVLSLFYLKPPDLQAGFDLRILPAFNAALNFSTALLLITGFYFIRNKKIQSHRLCMITAFCLSAVFLISYVIYHALTEPVSYGGEGMIRNVYFFILITHIILAAVIVPLVLITLVRGLQQRFDRHRRIARWTFPLWLYVAVTGVIVYLMLSPYY